MTERKGLYHVEEIMSRGGEYIQWLEAFATFGGAMYAIKARTQGVRIVWSCDRERTVLFNVDQPED